MPEDARYSRGLGVVVAAVGLGWGCGHGAGTKVVELPSGGSAVRVQCWDDRQECVEEAAATCPGGYDVLDKMHTFAPRGSGSGGRHIFTITIRCR